jgi:hypothetical protein
LAGTGVITATGGNAGGSTLGGGGGGGRIAAYFDTLAYDGVASVSRGVGSRWGEDGTVYFGPSVLRPGEQGSAPITLCSREQLTNLTFVLHVPTNRFDNLRVLALQRGICSVRIQPITATEFRVTVDACPGQVIQPGGQVLMLTFAATTNPSSLSRPFVVSDLQGSRADGTPASSSLCLTRVIIVGLEPVLDMVFAPAGQPQLILYARPGTTNVVQSSPSMRPVPFWTSWSTNVQTTLAQPFAPLSATNQSLFFRAMER